MAGESGPGWQVPTQKYRLEKYGRELGTDQWGQVRKGACKEHVYTPLPDVTSTKEATLVGKAEEGRRVKERSKQATILSLHLAKIRPTKLKSIAVLREQSGTGMPAPPDWGHGRSTATASSSILSPLVSQGYIRKLQPWHQHQPKVVFGTKQACIRKLHSVYTSHNAELSLLGTVSSFLRC